MNRLKGILGTITIVVFVCFSIYKYLSAPSFSESNIPDYNGYDYIYLNNNIPNFSDEFKSREAFESYSELDALGRCGVAEAKLSKELMPTKERGEIFFIHPTGWKNKKYDFIEGEYLYNRCHLIAYSLTGEDDNDRNLITCTRHMNSDVMNEFELKILNYIRKTNNHVLYRVTPVFDGYNMLSKGVQMEAYSVEDNGLGINFNIFVYNVQENISIDYLTGDNELSY